MSAAELVELRALRERVTAVLQLLDEADRLAGSTEGWATTTSIRILLEGRQPVTSPDRGEQGDE